MSTLRKINEPAPDESMVKLLEDLLADAKAGKITGLFVFTKMGRDKSVGRAWAGSVADNIFETYGMIQGEAMLWFVNQVAAANDGQVK